VLSTLGLVFHACAIFVLECKLLARERSSRFALCVVVFHIHASADASLYARRLACMKLVPFCSFKVVAIFCGSCFGVLCVVVCWMFEVCSWLVGWGGTKVSGS